MGKIYFDDDGSGKMVKTPVNNEFKAKKHKKSNGFQTFDTTNDVKNLQKRWFELYPNYNTFEDVKELKDSEQQEIVKKCELCFERESENEKKHNPSDSKWLETALHQGTARDKANAGALLVQSNPLSNLNALETLICQTKVTNKSSPDVLEVLSQLFMNSLLPKHRKLMSLIQRGNDWKKVKTTESLTDDEKSKIFAFWYFEEKIRDNYMSFLQNLKEQLSKGNEKHKSVGIRVAARLLAHGPEKEALLLNILVNKLGDPTPKIASAASYRLMEVLRTHPNMVEVMVIEAEKVLFRDNISDGAQHFTLSFLTCVARYANTNAANRLLKICFSMFKILTEKGDIYRKMIKLILLCIRTSMETLGSDATIPDETTSVMYRLIHLSELETALQALSVLMEVTFHQKTREKDRFYNALYKKISDPKIVTASDRVTNLFFHLFHRATQNDTNVHRAQAFIKRLLQASLAFPPAKVVGVLVVVNKILKSRAPLLKDGENGLNLEKPVENVNLEEKMAKFDDESDEEETYHDVPLEENGEKSGKKSKNEKKVSGWVHTKHENHEKLEDLNVKSEKSQPTSYDPYKRDPAYSGAQFTRKYELIQLLKHFHPSVQKIAEQTIFHKNLTYYGDPLRDFSVATFLDRFSFKNPKDLTTKKEDGATQKSLIYKKNYIPQGSRGISVHNLTKQNCTEEERYIFEFLEKKREKKNQLEEKLKEKEEEDAASDVSEVESVSDDEFNEYLDGLGAAGGTIDSDDENIDYMGELGGNLKKNEKKKGKQVKNEEESSEDDQWSDDDAEDANSDEELDKELEIDSNDEGSVSFDENDLQDDDDDDDDDDDASVMTFSGDESDDSGPSNKKRKGTQMSDKAFNKKLKQANSESLFAAADDFSEMLEASSKDNKDHGTLGEIFNKDKSSLKQLAWEASKMRDFHGEKKGKNSNKFMANKKGGKKFAAKSGKVTKGKKFDGKKFVTQKHVNRRFQKKK